MIANAIAAIGMEPWGFEPQILPCHGSVIPFHYGPARNRADGETLAGWGEVSSEARLAPAGSQGNRILRRAAPNSSPGTPGEVRVRVLIDGSCEIAEEPSPLPSPGVPGEGVATGECGCPVRDRRLHWKAGLHGPDAREELVVGDG